MGNGMHVDLGDWDPALSAWKAVHAAIGEVNVRGLKIHGTSFDLENFGLASHYETRAELDWDELHVMRLDRVTMRTLEVDAADLKAFVEKRVPGMKLNSLTLDGTVKAEGSWNGHPLALEAALELDRAARRLKVAVVSASYMGIPVPAALFRPIKELNLSLRSEPGDAVLRSTCRA